MSQELVKKECEMWSERGKNVRYERRQNRNGYKAGALKVGMRYSYVESCEFIAMFDADFQPAPDFLLRTVPFLVHNPKIALVQSRWKFGTCGECSAQSSINHDSPLIVIPSIIFLSSC